MCHVVAVMLDLQSVRKIFIPLVIIKKDQIFRSFQFNLLVINFAGYQLQVANGLIFYLAEEFISSLQHPSKV